VVVIYAPRSPDGNALWEYCAQRGWDEVRAISDASLLTRAVRAGKVDIVLCSKLDRLGRSIPELTQVIRDFAEWKITLIVPGQGVDASTPPEMILDVLEIIAEFKHSVAQERISAGLNAARRRGVKLGRPETVNAYREDVARLRAQGLTGRAIAKELGVPSANVFKVLKHPVA